MILLMSCSTNIPDIYGLDYIKWIEDKNGCKGERIKLVHHIIKNSDKFLRFSQNQMIDILGKPDNQTLYTRGQTIYFYYVKYNDNCKTSEIKNEDDQIKLEIRFDALNRSKELYVHNY
tara:strand:+ start:80 stop:433 length:354 start_codon:yes stop_codon:yes gene_type:complete